MAHLLDVGSPRPVPRWEWPLVLGLAALGALAVLIATRHGAAIDPDSVTYASTAHNLAHGHGVTDFTGDPLTVFPPGYPAILALGDLVGVSPLTFGRFLGAATDSLIVVLAYLLIRRHVRLTGLVIAGTVLVAGSMQLVTISGTIASDPGFIALALAFTLVIDRLRTDHQRRNLLVGAASGLVGVAFLLRYAAAGLLVAGVIVLAVLFKRDGLHSVVRRTSAFAAGALVLPVLWVIRSAFSNNPDLLGIRVGSDDSLPGLLKQYFRQMASLGLPRSISTPALLAIAFGGLLFLIAVTWPSRDRVIDHARRETGALVPIATVGLVFAAFVLLSAKTAGIDTDARQLLPIWPIVITIVGVFLVWIVESDRGNARRISTRAVRALVSTFLVGSIVWCARQVDVGIPGYYHYHASADHALQAVGREIPPSDLLMSNDPWRIYLVTQREPVELAPIPILARFSHRPLSMDAVLDALCRRSVDLIWFSNSPASGTRDVNDLVGRKRVVLERRAHFVGGDLYRVSVATEDRNTCSTASASPASR